VGNQESPVSPVLGDMSVQGNIKPLRSLTEPLQVAKDNGAKRALIPIENKRNFLDVNAADINGTCRPGLLRRSQDSGDEGAWYYLKTPFTKFRNFGRTERTPFRVPLRLTAERSHCVKSPHFGLTRAAPPLIHLACLTSPHVSFRSALRHRA
jgi:hypothetical protein